MEFISIKEQGINKQIRISLNDLQISDEVKKENGSYLEKMVVSNKISSILNMKKSQMNENEEYIYEINGGISFEKMFANNTYIKDKDINIIINSIKKLATDIENYLLNIDDVYIDAKYMFYFPLEKTYKFLYIPYYSFCSDYTFRNGLKNVWDKILENIDYEENVMRVYKIYQKICVGEFDIKTFCENRVEKSIEKDKIFKEKKSVIKNHDDNFFIKNKTKKEELKEESNHIKESINKKDELGEMEEILFGEKGEKTKEYKKNFYEKIKQSVKNNKKITFLSIAAGVVVFVAVKFI